MSNGRYCDNCETHLNDEDYVSYGSWSYTCHDCGFSYRHGSAGVGEQVAKFNSRPTPRAADFADCHACGIVYPNTATRCTKCGGELQSR